VSQTISVPRRFNGLLTSGHGGYSSGVISALVEGTAEVTLRSPVPLDTALDVLREDEDSVRVLDGETLIAEARSVPELRLEIPGPVSVDEHAWRSRATEASLTAPSAGWKRGLTGRSSPGRSTS
jgi:hypothetical protein